MIDDTRLLSKQLAYGLVGFGLLFTATTSYLFNFTDALPPHHSVIATNFLYFSTLTIMPLLAILATRNSRFKLAAIVWIIFTLMVMLIFFNELNGPFTPMWSMLILIASIYYGWRGFIYSSLCLPLMSIVYIGLFHADLQPSVAVYTGISLLINFLVILTSYLFVRIILDSRKTNHNLMQAQKSEQVQVNRLNTLLNSISDAVLTLNRYGRVTTQNAAAQAFFDTNESLIGRDIDKILQPVDENNKPVSIRGMVSEIKSAKLRDDFSINVDGDVRHLSVQFSRIRGTFDDNEEYGFVIIIRDITKQKSLEEEKDEFISVTSHELRTPVAIAEGSISNLLLLEERHADSNKIRKAAEAAHDQVVYLAKMINDLSTLSRAERGVGDVIEEINTNDLLNDLFARYSPEADAKSLHLNLDMNGNLPTIETSRLYLEEILQNFVTNSIKYTKSGSVTLGASVESDGKIKFFVKDTGIGMSKTDAEHIFEKFYRSEDYRTRETSGTGLGLYVVAKLAKKLSTQINVDSRLNNGSEFSFVMSLKSKMPVGTGTPVPVAVPARPLKRDETPISVAV